MRFRGSTRRAALASILACVAPAAIADTAQPGGSATGRARPGEASVVLPSAFVSSEESEVPLSPLKLPAVDTNKPGNDGRTNERVGWLRRRLSDWTKNADHPTAGSQLFSRLRRQETPPSDSLLTSRCRAILLGEPMLHGVWIHVATEGGVVHLRGTVPTESVRLAAETAAWKTPGATDIRNELTVAAPASGTVQASFVSASLATPERLDGSSLIGPSTPSEERQPKERSAASVSAGGRPSVVLGQPVQIDSRAGLPEVRTYVIQRPTSGVPAAMPPFAMEQRVAKTSAEPPVLPSGFRMLGGSGRNGVIPARGGPANADRIVAMPSATTASVVAARVGEDGLGADVRAILSADPRAKSLLASMRGSEIRLSGSIRTPEDLYDLSEKLNALPGVDFVSFDDVKFTF